MNPLNRRMFRDPRAARRATGILASSAPLMTSAQKAMAQGQPMRAQTGAAVNTGGGRFGNRFDSTDQVPILRFFQGNTPVPNTPQISRSSGFVQDSIADTLFNALRPMGYGAQGGTMQQRKEFERMRPYLEAGADRTAPSGLPLDRYALRGTMPGPGVGITSVLSDNLSDMEMQNRQPRFLGTDEDVPYGRTAEDATGGGGVPLSDAERMRLAELQSMRDLESSRTAPDAAPGAGTPDAPETTAAEDLSALRTEIDAKADPTRKDPFATDGVGPEAEKKKSPGKGTTATKDQAEQNDKDLGIDPKLSRKERVEQRYQMLKDLLGEDEAKDVRTDKNYNLMMLGLRIAAGQSEDALSNIAAGAGQQLAEFGEVKGALQQQQQQQERELKLLATTEVGEEIAAEEARAFTTSERIGSEIARAAMQDTALAAQEALQVNSQAFQAAQNALGRDHAEFMANSEQQFRVQLTEINQKFQGEENKLNREAAVTNLLMTQRWQALEASKGRIHDLDKTIAAQNFAREQGVSEQAFRIRLAEFTASLPSDTQRLYEKYLDPDEIGAVIVKSITGKTTAAAPSAETFVSDNLKNEELMRQLRVEIGKELTIKPEEVEISQLQEALVAMYRDIQGAANITEETSE